MDIRSKCLTLFHEPNTVRYFYQIWAIKLPKLKIFGYFFKLFVFRVFQLFFNNFIQAFLFQSLILKQQECMKCKVNSFSRGLVLMLCFAAFSNFAWAQKTISGLVTDSDNKEPLVGASVVVTGTTKGTLTDVDGKYTLEIPKDTKTLTFSFTGYSNLTVNVPSGNTLDVNLKGGTVLDQVVVIGYGDLKQKEITSAVTSIKAEDFNKGNVNDPIQLLQGKVAGLQIARNGGDPNGDFQIRLRGLSTVGANVEPLIVIDGVPGGSLKSIDPSDIASMEVLKDAGSGAIYGTRGSSGVIIVTTKRGQAGKTTVEYSGILTTENIAKSVSVMTPEEFNSANPDPKAKLGQKTDWLSQVTRQGLTHVHNLSLGGGLNKTTFRIGLNYRDVQGIALNDGFKQINGRLNLTQKALDDKLTVSVDVSSTTKDAQYGYSEAFRYAITNNPTQPVYDAAALNQGGYSQITGFDYFNPVAIANQSTSLGNISRIVASVRAEYEIVKGLKISQMYARNTRAERYSQYYSKFATFRGGATSSQLGYGSGAFQTENGTEEYASTVIDYKTKFDKLNFSILGGYDFNYFVTTKGGAAATGFTTDAYGANALGTASDVINGFATPYSEKFDSKLIAFFSRAVFNYDDTYFLQASVRREGSSKFGVNNKWGIFPAVSAGVNISKLAKIDGVDNLKLRVSYGITGNTPKDSYLSIARFQQSTQYFLSNGNYVPVYLPASNDNPDLKWERKAETNVGVDFLAMDGRLSGSVDYFTRNTTDLLYDFPVPATKYVFSTITANVGQIDVSGIEAVLNLQAVKTQNLTWSTGINFSSVSQKLVSLSSGDLKFGSGGVLETANVGAPGLNGINQIYLKEGQPIGQIYGPVYVGAKADGSAIYQDLDGNGKIEKDGADRRVLGSGWNNTFSFGQFDLNFLIRGAFGHSLVNEYRVFYEKAPDGNLNVVKTKFYDPNLKTGDYSSRAVEKADYVKLDNITFGYNVKLPQGSSFSKARIFISANNPLVLTSYTGVDPEVRYSDVGSSDNGGTASRQFNPDPLAPGIDRRTTYFRTFSTSLGVNFSF
jgi:TonB-dependent starch-binding outer membrane protein SusC